MKWIDASTYTHTYEYSDTLNRHMYQYTCIPYMIAYTHSVLCTICVQVSVLYKMCICSWCAMQDFHTYVVTHFPSSVVSQVQDQ